MFAYLQPDGSWGWSNAGLVAGDGASLLVDTLFDLDLTAAMLDAMTPVTARPRRSPRVVNTHANGDHCYGNQLVPARASRSSRRQGGGAGDGRGAAGAAGRDGEADLADEALNAFVAEVFGPFRFAGIDVVPPTRTFTGTLVLEVAARRSSSSRRARPTPPAT